MRPTQRKPHAGQLDARNASGPSRPGQSGAIDDGAEQLSLFEPLPDAFLLCAVEECAEHAEVHLEDGRWYCPDHAAEIVERCRFDAWFGVYRLEVP